METRSEYQAAPNGQIEADDELLQPDPVAVAFDALNAGEADDEAIELLEAARRRQDAPVVIPGHVVADWIREDDARGPIAIGQALAVADPGRGLDVTPRHALNPPPVSWLVQGWIPEATLTVLTGAGGAGKSRIALQLAVALATGAETFIEPGSGAVRLTGLNAPSVIGDGAVVFAAWETRQLAWANRLAAICGQGQERADRMQALEDRLFYVNMRPAGGLWGATRREQLGAPGAWLDGGGRLTSFVESVTARLLIIDPVAAAFVSNENDRAQVRAFLSALDEWAESCSCTVLLISHPPKAEGHAQSGSTDWRNGVQSVLDLAACQDDPGVRRLQVDKLNEGPIPDPVHVSFDAGRFVEVQAPGGGDGDQTVNERGFGV